MQFFVSITIEEGTPMTPPTPEGMMEMGRLMQEGVGSGLILATGQLDDTTTYV